MKYREQALSALAALDAEEIECFPTDPDQTDLVHVDFSEIEKRILANINSTSTNPVTGLTYAQTERLAMLAEEASEVAQMAGKIMRFGYDSRHPDGGPTNLDLLIGEVKDLLAVLKLMNRPDLGKKLDTIDAPASKVHRKLRYSRFQGTDHAALIAEMNQ